MLDVRQQRIHNYYEQKVTLRSYFGLISAPQKIDTDF